MVPTPLIFTYGKTRDPQSPPHDSSAETMKHKGNPTPRNNPPNLVPNVPDYLDSVPDGYEDRKSVVPIWY